MFHQKVCRVEKYDNILIQGFLFDTQNQFGEIK